MLASARDEYFAAWARRHGDYDATQRWWPRMWLTMCLLPALGLARCRVPPDVVTVGGVIVSGFVPILCGAGGRWPLIAVAVVTATAILDTVDGAVATLLDRVSAYGHRLDSGADRITELLWVVGAVALGAPWWSGVAALVVSTALELLRAVRLSGDLGVVTVAERPVRVLLAAVMMLAAGVVPDNAAMFGTIGSILWLAFSAVGVAQLLVVIRRYRLRRPLP